MMRKRRLAGDERARVPFAMVAVLILMLSIFSMAYLGGIQRQQAGLRLAEAELSRQTAIMNRVEDRMALEGFYIASRAVAASTQFLCNQSMLDRCFQENYSAYLEDNFPLYTDPYLVELRDFRPAVYLEERNTKDLVASNRTMESEVSISDSEGTPTNASVQVLDTVSGNDFSETSVLARYIFVAGGNCTVTNTRSGSASERRIEFEKGIESPFPLMNSKAAAMEASAGNNAMGLARTVKYILTTVAQFRVLEGYGSGLDTAPGDLSEIVSQKDVWLAVNLAVLLESVRLFRSYDWAVLRELDGLGLEEGGQSLESLFADYLNMGTLDPADIIALFMGLGDRDLPADIILAQAFNAIIDQFILKYLDYFGIADIANWIYKSFQQLRNVIEDVGKTLSSFIFGDDGEGRKEAEQVTRWLMKSTAAIDWPPQPGAASVQGVIAGADLAAPTDLAVLDVLQPVDTAFHYSGNISQLLSESGTPILDADGQLIGQQFTAVLQMYNISAATLPSQSSAYPAGYLADFTPVSMVRQTDDMTALWSDFYEQHYAPSEDVIYETVRDAVKNVTHELASLIISFMGSSSLTLSGYAEGEYAIDPCDRTSVLQDTRDLMASVISETAAYLQDNPGTVSSLLSVLTDSQSKLTLRFIEFVAANYDTISGRDNCIADATATISLSVLQNSTQSYQTLGTQSAVYSVYNDLGHSRGLVDDALPYTCIATPDTKAIAMALWEQNGPVLNTDLKPYAESAYASLKAAEARWSYIGSADNGLYIKALEGSIESLTGSILTRFIGSNSDSLIGLARDMVINVMDGIIWSGGVSNTQYAPELVFSDASGAVGFELCEGNFSEALESGSMHTESFSVVQPDGAVEAIAAGGQVAESGVISVNISQPTGVHFTDITSFNERPFENRWNVTVSGSVRILASSASMPYIGNGSRVPASLERTVSLDMCIPVLAFSGWNLVGINYTNSATLAGDVEKLLDILTAFFDWVWETLTAPINWLVDQVMMIVDFFADIVGKLLAYASELMEKVTQIIGVLVEQIQAYITEIADSILSSIADWIIDLLPDGTEFRFSMFGFDFIVEFATDSEMDRVDAGYGGQMISVRTEGRLLGIGFDVGIEIWALDDNVSAEAGLDYDILLDAELEMFGFSLDIKADPFMILREKIVECRGRGAGWQMELDSPVIENIYDSVRYSLHDIQGVGAALSNIPIPFLGLKASVNAGIDIRYTLRGLEEDNPVINEVEINPRGLDNGTQWAELYNPTGQNISLENWTLSYGNNASYNITFNSTALVAPFGYWVVHCFNRTLPTESVKFELLDPGGKRIDATPILSEPDSGTVNNISVGTSGCGATWQRAPNGANLTLAGKWNFTWGSIGAENAAIDIQFKPLVMALLKGAFNATWNDLKDELALSLDFIVKLVTQFIQRFIEDVLLLIERSVVETALFLDVMLTDATGSGGGGIMLSFVIKGGDTLASILRWIIGSVSVFLAKFGKPTQPSQYPKLAEDIPEKLYVRLDFYGLVQMPKALQKASGDEEEPQPIKMVGRIEANIPALAALAGKEMGRWRINFGVYVESVPPKIADSLFDTGNRTVNVWLFKGTVWET